MILADKLWVTLKETIQLYFDSAGLTRTVPAVTHFAAAAADECAAVVARLIASNSIAGFNILKLQSHAIWIPDGTANSGFI